MCTNENPIVSVNINQNPKASLSNGAKTVMFSLELGAENIRPMQMGTFRYPEMGDFTGCLIYENSVIYILRKLIKMRINTELGGKVRADARLHEIICHVTKELRQFISSAPHTPGGNHWQNDTESSLKLTYFSPINRIE